jgi:hypothetical protein
MQQQHQQTRKDLDGQTTNWNIYSSISDDDETDDNDYDEESSQCSTSATIALGDFIDSQKGFLLYHLDRK